MKRTAKKDKKIQAEKERLRKESAAIVSQLTPHRGDQHARCDYCGQSYLVERESASIGCALCTETINQLPRGARFIFNAIVRRLTACEELRVVDESSINAIKTIHWGLQSRLINLEKRAVKRGWFGGTRKKRKGRR
jgi:hypothetical protein